MLSKEKTEKISENPDAMQKGMKKNAKTPPTVFRNEMKQECEAVSKTKEINGYKGRNNQENMAKENIVDKLQNKKELERNQLNKVNENETKNKFNKGNDNEMKNKSNKMNDIKTVNRKNEIKTPNNNQLNNQYSNTINNQFNKETPSTDDNKDNFFENDNKNQEANKKKEYLNQGLDQGIEDPELNALRALKISVDQERVISKELLQYKDTRWSELGLSPKTIRILCTLGYDFPSPVQYHCIPEIIKGKDILARAKNGGGKSLAFLIPIIEKIDPTKNTLQAIVLAPTRELAIQIARFARALGRDLGIKSAPLIGGSNIADDIIRISMGLHLLVGTPGRLFSILSRRICEIDPNPLIVFDEADKLLDSTFYESISQFLDMLPRKKQLCLFSATFPQATKSFMNINMNSPKLIKVNEEYTLCNVSHFYCTVNPYSKLPCLKALLTALDIRQCIIYVNSKQACQLLSEKILDMGFSCYFIHSKLSQDERNLILHNFTKNKTQILVSSDITTRGTDVQGVNLVINFELPKSSESYLHRIGRAGRFGTNGCCITMIYDSELDLLKSYAAVVGSDVNPCSGAQLKRFCKN